MSVEILRIPEERKAVLIGPDGKTKQGIENDTGTRIRVGDAVRVEGEPDRVYLALEMIKAIGRGFSPEDAMNLLDEDYCLRIIELTGETRKTIKRLMGRVIGRQGAARNIIQELTETRVVVYGKTVGILGPWKGVERARQAVEDLLEGRSHGYVYRRLQSQGGGTG